MGIEPLFEFMVDGQCVGVAITAREHFLALTAVIKSPFDQGHRFLGCHRERASETMLERLSDVCRANGNKGSVFSAFADQAESHCKATLRWRGPSSSTRITSWYCPSTGWPLLTVTIT